MDRPDGFQSTKSRSGKAVAPASQDFWGTRHEERCSGARTKREGGIQEVYPRRPVTAAWCGGLSLGSVGLLVLAVVLLTLSPALSLRTVVVEGASRVSPESVQEALAEMYGEPLARISNDRVGVALSSLTLIQAFQTRIEPPGTLIVSIDERKPVGGCLGCHRV